MKILLIALMLLALLVALFFGDESAPEIKHHEKYYQTQLCKQLNGVMEFRLPDNTRVDCLTEQYAIEVDWARKWAEGIGQSLFYAEMTQKKPAVALILGDNDERYLQRINKVAGKLGITVIEMKK